MTFKLEDFIKIKNVKYIPNKEIRCGVCGAKLEDNKSVAYRNGQPICKRCM